MHIIKKSLKFKVTLLMISLLFISSLANFVIQDQIIYSSFLHIEQQEAVKNLQRVKHTIDDEISDISKFLFDWSAWDDSYEYVQNPSADYEASNLIDSTFTSFGLHLIFILNNENEVIWGKVLSSDLEKEIELMAFNKVKLPADHLALQFEEMDKSPVQQKLKNASMAGIISTEYGPMFIASRPILRSDDTGPSMGTFIMGKFITKTTLGNIKKQVQIPFELILSDATYLSHQFASIAVKENKNSGTYIETGEKELIGYVRYSDLSSKMAFIVKTHHPRVITEKGIQALRISGIVQFVTTFAVLLIAGYFLHTSILNPIKMMTNFLLELKVKRDFNSRVAIKNPNEIGILADGLNDMCSTIFEQTNLLTQINLNLEYTSSTDALTGIANRRTFDQAYSNYWKTHFREQQSFAIIIADIDNFKLYNDTYGHQKGDECLKTVAQSIQQTLKRDSDFVARYGGEEFVIILPNTDIEGVNNVAEKIRASIENLQIPHEKSTIGDIVTISLGGGSIIPSKDISAAEFFDAVDQVLYRAKERGRNQVRLVQ